MLKKSIVNYVPIVVIKCLIIIALIIEAFDLSAQSHADCSFCRAVESGNLYSVGKQFKWEVNLRKHGDLINNTYYVYYNQINELVLWLRSHPCVVEATQEQCAIHIDIYPGWTYIGARFKTRDSIVEKAFYIQEGKIHRFRSRLRSLPICILNHLKTESDILVYRKMIDSPGFCEQQRKNCKQMQEQDSIQRIEYLQALSLSTDTTHIKLKIIDNKGGDYLGQFGTAHYNFIAFCEDSQVGKGIDKGETIALSMNLSKENVDWLKNWSDPRPPMGWELIQPGNSYIFIINRQIEPQIIKGKKILNYYLYGGANCVSLIEE